VHRGRCVSNEPCVLFIAFEGPVDATPVAGSALQGREPSNELASSRPR
jgi:hypothetical protein